MSTLSIEKFFAGKNLVIPDYQRDYAWKKVNIDALFSDVEEALEVGGHYLGTFILSQAGPRESVYVVDGQQRLTTLTMILDALIDTLEDQVTKDVRRSAYIRDPENGPKFQVLGENREFFENMLEKKNPEPSSAGQERLKEAYQHIRLRVQSLEREGGQTRIKEWLKTLTNMEVLEFIERDEGKAIRMFQTVNDRGVPLAKMDIVKSLLIYYSNRYLDGALDQMVAQQFGAAFRAFSNVKDMAAQPGYKVQNIDRESFSEDDVLRYHYFAFDAAPFGADAGGDYNATSDSVLASFLKPALQKLRTDPQKLRSFIEAYTNDLAQFFQGLKALLDATRTERATYMLFVVQDVSATLYPLLIRLHLKQLLDKSTDTGKRNLLSWIEMVDLRVFKLRGTNPQADVFWMTRELSQKTLQEIISDLKNFCQKFMPDTLMLSRLESEDLYRNMGLPRMLWEEENQVRQSLGHPAVSIQEMAKLNAAKVSVEHVLPQDPAFDITSYGFNDAADFDDYKHRLGNLLLLERDLNSACQNKTVEEKVSASQLYASSALVAVKAFAADRSNKPQGYKKENIENRCKTLGQALLESWPIAE